MRRFLPLLLLPALLGAAAPPADGLSMDDGNALLECRQTRTGAENVRNRLKELSHSGSPGGLEYSYDVARFKPFGTSKPKLMLTQYENQYGSMDEYIVLLNGKYDAVKTRLLQTLGAKCEKEAAQSCSFWSGGAQVELSLNAKGQLALSCQYED